MASKACTTCLQSLGRQSRSITKARKSTTFITTRSFNRHDIFQGELPQKNGTPSTSVPPGSTKSTTNPAEGSATKAALKAAIQLRKIAGKSVETYTAYGSTEELYKTCAAEADYSIPQAQEEDAEMPKTDDGEDLGVGAGWWHTEAHLQPTFSTWSQVTMLHMYLLVTRFRCFHASEAQIWQQHLLDHFFYDAENKMMINHNMHARGTRNKYLKDMFIQWRGLLAAYDEGIAKGDAVLASAIWRNLFKANEEVDVRVLAQIVSFVRRSLKELDAMPENDVMSGRLEFGSPALESKIVSLRSKMLDIPLEGVQAPPPGVPKKKS